MLYALSSARGKIRAIKDTSAVCPKCHGVMIAKCGAINIWHWAHKSKSSDCEHGGESEWHLAWKALLPKEMCEVMIEKDGTRKWADAVLKNGTVVEFQHSPITPLEIRTRERFYGNMIWVFDAIDAFSSGRLDLRYTEEDYHTFRWMHAKKSVAHCEKPIYLDIGYFIFRLKKIHPEAPVGGWGVKRLRSVFNEYLTTH